MTSLFSLADPLPTGTTVLEASAGTGKTYAIAALSVRFVAEARADAEDLLLVTFSRAATAELRLRVRDRFRRSAAALRAAAGGVPPLDEVDVLLCEGLDAAALLTRAERLERAFSRFDRVTIATTHEFCHGMLRGLGVLAPQTPQSRLVEDLTPLADEAAADLYLQRWADDPSPPPLPFSDDPRGEPGARHLARDAVHTEGRLVADDAAPRARERTMFAAAVREEVARRKRERRLYGFDDQLLRLAHALADPVSGDAARERLATRFRVVLVDEFQDTDPVQWEVIRQAFVGRSTVILIGDPKQAIYAFRGADVHTYTTAVASADARSTLGVNHRSDAPVVAAVGGLFAGVLLGEGIGAPAVRAHHPRRLLVAPDSPWCAGVQIRHVENEVPLSPTSARHRISADLVGLVATLLGPDAPVRRPDAEPLRGSDIAVLVRYNESGERLARQLGEAGIPATFNGTRSVFSSPAALDWIALLQALDQTRRPFLQRALVTDLVGATVPELAGADEARLGEWSLTLHRWARVLAGRGVPALLAAVEEDSRLSARLLSQVGGERRLTDHRHLVELLHAQAISASMTRPRDLAAWLEANVSSAEAGTERTRRLETDDDAVQIMTVHRAKGLQWPVVLVPEACTERAPGEDRGATLVIPGPDGRVLDVAGQRAPGRRERFDRWRAEECDESLRALYVALTRAQGLAVTWWAHHQRVGGTPLHRLLHATHDPERPARPAAYQDPASLPDGGTPRLVPWLAATSVVAVPADLAPPTPASRRPVPVSDLAARRWTRTIDHTWRRTSYTGLTAQAHPEATLLADEGAEPVEVRADPAFAQASPLAGLPGGAAFGTLVHAVYESTDATGDGWRQELRRRVAEAMGRLPLAGVDADALAAALEPSFTTPLGPLAPGATLRLVAPRDRLSELDFEFPLANPAATVADIAALLADHLPPDSPLAGYPARLAVPGLAGQRLVGFLTGSIDAVLRLRRPEGDLHLIVDYKTNRLSSTGEGPDELTIGHYTPSAMAEAMMASHYPLQALLYAVALHRFLRLRLAGYDPERHLGGVAYLFVRGMAGPHTPLVAGHPLGVFSWRPSVGLVTSVSRLLAGSR